MFLKQLPRKEQIDWLISAQSDLSLIEMSLPEIRKSCIDGVESSAYKGVLEQLKDQALETYDVEMEATVEGLEGFATILRSAIVKVRDTIKGDRSAHRKIIQGKEKELDAALKEYTGSDFSYTVKTSDKKIKIKIPIYAATPDNIITVVLRHISTTQSMFKKYQPDISRCGKAITTVYQKAEKAKDDSDESFYLDHITPLLDISPVEKYYKDLNYIDKTKEDTVNLMTEKEIKNTIDFFKKVVDHTKFMDSVCSEIYSWYRIWDNFDEEADDRVITVNDSKVSTSLLDNQIDEMSFLSSNVEDFIIHACQTLEEWMLKSIK